MGLGLALGGILVYDRTARGVGREVWFALTLAWTAVVLCRAALSREMTTVIHSYFDLLLDLRRAVRLSSRPAGALSLLALLHARHTSPIPTTLHTPSTHRHDVAHQHGPIHLAAPMGTERKRQALNKQKRALTGADAQAQPAAPSLAKIKKKNSKKLPNSRLKASRRPLNGSTKKKHLDTLKPGAAKKAALAAAAATTQAY